MTSQGIPALPQELDNQRAFSCHMITIVEGREASNVVLPTMGNKRSFIQLANMHRPTPCITPLGLESDNNIQYAETTLDSYYTITEPYLQLQ